MKHLTSMLALICVALTVITFPIMAQTIWSSANTGNNITSAETQFNLGLSYYEKKDYSEAMKCFRKIAEQGNASAQYMLGICYKNGFGEYGEAMKWFRKAADQGHAYAQFELGYCYEYRLGDKKEANYWYRKAAENGYEGAAKNLKTNDAEKDVGDKSFLNNGSDSASAEAREIDKVIALINKIDQDGKETSGKEELPILIRRTITELRAIDTSRCPRDFCVAYEHMIQILENLYVLAIDAPGNIFTGMISVFTGWAFEYDKGLKQFQNACAVINQIAAKYGAKNRLRTCP